ncbi:MAG: hypothetical protein IJR35_10000 [Synergistaceae bacterium]|nr:hypothetical protein [Synergistaceae bacterium]MBR0204946.1 hypothetical protein [Synergistaceae bacterium]
MRKFKVYGLLIIIMLLSVLLLSGCGGSIGGGSSDSESEDGSTDDGTTNEQTTPNSNPDTNDIAAVLNATWIGLTGTGSVLDPEANEYTWTLAKADVTFEGTYISGDRGFTSVTSHFIWSVMNPDGAYVGAEHIDREDQDADMIRAGSDSWICEYEDSEGQKHSMTINLTDKDSYTYFNLTEEGEIESPDFNYNYYKMEANFRRETEAETETE